MMKSSVTPMLIDDHWDVWHLSTCHRGVICILLRSILWGKTRCPVLIRPAVMFLMTSSPLQAMEEFSDFPPVTPVGLLLFVSGLNVNFDTFKFSKDSQQETTCVCVCVCALCCQAHTHKWESETRSWIFCWFKNESNFPWCVLIMLFVYNANFIYSHVGLYCKI